MPLPAPNPTQQKIIDIAAKYGYRAESYAARWGKGGKIVHYIGLASTDRFNPYVYFNESKYGTGEITGIDRFEINHSAVGSQSIQAEREFLKKVEEAIKMCEELNEVDLSGLPVRGDESVNSSRRSKIKEIFDKV